MADKNWSYLNLATHYPDDNTLLKHEFDKILSEPKRRENIQKAEAFLDKLTGRPAARPPAARKAGKPRAARAKGRKRSPARSK